MLLVHKLDLVGNIVRAELLGLVEVHCGVLRGDVEEPLTEQLVTNAVNWLICLGETE